MSDSNLHHDPHQPKKDWDAEIASAKDLAEASVPIGPDLVAMMKKWQQIPLRPRGLAALNKGDKK